MGRTLRRVAATLLSTALILSLPTAASAVSDPKRAENAVAYLATQQKPNGSIPAFSPIGSTSDAVVAFVAAGVGRGAMNRAIGFLRRQTEAGNVDAIGLRAKVILALNAAGADPRDFGGHNLLKEVRTTIGDNGHFGDSAVFDDALALLAMLSADVRPGIATATWLIDAQCPDGGWAYDLPYDPVTDDEHCHSGDTDVFDADSNTTSYVVQALAARRAKDWTADPFAYLDTVRDPDKGGWSYSAAFIATDANSTALVIQAYAADTRALPGGGLKALRQLQYPNCGAWAYAYNGDVRGDPDVGATIGAVPGLLQEALPITGPVAKGLPTVPVCA